VLVLYHYFHPDDVVSAQHFADLSTGLQSRGWDVTVMPSNRGCRDESIQYLGRETWRDVHIHRVWRPRFRQASTLGRLLNSAWMILAWSLAAIRQRPDVLIIGTDPIFSILTAIPWRILKPRTKIFHWCFDLHPEAAIAEGMVSPNHLSVRILRPFLRKAYQCCHLHGSLGPCMTARLRKYTTTVPIALFTPWALAEPPEPLQIDPDERHVAFGNAELGLMYSGNFGKAHEADLFLALARKLRHQPDIRFVFSVRGNRATELHQLVTHDDTNVSFIDFAPQDKLEQRLSAADTHMVSLRAGYEGTVVPSKFQGALAAGRPILYSGPVDSAVSEWINEYGLGWNLTPDNLDQVAQNLVRLKDDTTERQTLNQHCFDVYHAQFSRMAVIDRLNLHLRGLLEVLVG
jgi:glycosyltransferase involved in cell wall biosynthesis